MSQAFELPQWPTVVFTEMPPDEEVSPRLLDLHSFINLLNVIGSVASLAGGRQPTAALQTLIVTVERATGDFLSSDGASVEELLVRSELRNTLAGLIHEWAAKGGRHAEWSTLLTEILTLFDRRLQEYRENKDQPTRRKVVGPDEIRDPLLEFFQLMARYSGGRFEVTDSEPEHRAGTHFVRFDLEPGPGGVFELPQLALDSIYDFAANARKYSPLGGKIDVYARRTPKGVVLGVRDEGVGIPEEELRRVVRFGYRARNAGAITTMGGGFGLTKALSVAVRHRGSLTIASILGMGTVVEMLVPDPA